MINFTVGPVQAPESILAIGAEQVPYFRTPEFSKIMLENEQLFLKFVDAPSYSKAVFITGSGTASMESAVINTLSKKDKVLVINGGSFGHRFAEILCVHQITFDEIKIEFGHNVHAKDLEPYNNKGYTALIVNVHETSTGVHYDMDLISNFCKINRLFLIVDAISSFLADEFSMNKYGVDVMITGSQKALACPPGVSILALSANAQERIKENPTISYYLDLKAALLNQMRGQTPFTPAVGILLQIHRRLKEIENAGGEFYEINKTRLMAEYFRQHLAGLPLEITSESMSNAVTPLHPTTASAYDIFTILKDEYDIWICPSGGELKDYLFRVGHLGDLTTADYDKLIESLRDLQKRKLL